MLNKILTKNLKKMKNQKKLNLGLADQIVEETSKFSDTYSSCLKENLKLYLKVSEEQAILNRVDDETFILLKGSKLSISTLKTIDSNPKLRARREDIIKSKCTKVGNYYELNENELFSGRSGMHDAGYICRGGEIKPDSDWLDENGNKWGRITGRFGKSDSIRSNDEQYKIKEIIHSKELDADTKLQMIDDIVDNKFAHRR